MILILKRRPDGRYNLEIWKGQVREVASSLACTFPIKSLDHNSICAVGIKMDKRSSEQAREFRYRCKYMWQLDLLEK